MKNNEKGVIYLVISICLIFMTIMAVQDKIETKNEILVYKLTTDVDGWNLLEVVDVKTTELSVEKIKIEIKQVFKTYKVIGLIPKKSREIKELKRDSIYNINAKIFDDKPIEILVCRTNNKAQNTVEVDNYECVLLYKNNILELVKRE